MIYERLVCTVLISPVNPRELGSARIAGSFNSSACANTHVCYQDPKHQFQHTLRHQRAPEPTEMLYVTTFNLEMLFGAMASSTPSRPLKTLKWGVDEEAWESLDDTAL